MLAAFRLFVKTRKQLYCYFNTQLFYSPAQNFRVDVLSADCTYRLAVLMNDILISVIYHVT
jgi:hypothetical protein